MPEHYDVIILHLYRCSAVHGFSPLPTVLSMPSSYKGYWTVKVPGCQHCHCPAALSPCFPADLNRDLPESDRHKGMACMPRPVRSPGITSTAPDEPATAALAKQQVKASNIAQEQITSQYISQAAKLSCCRLPCRCSRTDRPDVLHTAH